MEPKALHPETTDHRGPSRYRSRPVRPRWPVTAGVAAATYIVLAVVCNGPAWVDGAAHTMSGGDYPDPLQNVWYLGYQAFPVLHGASPLSTSYLNAPYGFNLLDNASLILPGLVAAPVSAAFGPIAAFNVLQVVAMAGSATAMFAVLRRFVAWPGAVYLGGLLYGFSPYMVGHVPFWLNLSLMVAPPLALGLGVHVFVDQTGRPGRWGLALAGLAVAQFFTSTEVLVDMVLVGALALAVALVLGRRHVRAKAPFALRALGVALGVSLVGLAYPVWYATHGPGHVHGPVHKRRELAPYSADLLGPVLPTSVEAVAPPAVAHYADRFVDRDEGENGSYLGVPLIVGLAVVTVKRRRDPVVVWAAAMAAATFVLSLGPRLVIGTHITAIRLPYTLLAHTPIVENAISVRFSLYVVFFGAVLGAIGVDAWHRALRSGGPAVVRPAALIAAVAVCLLPLVPRVPSTPYVSPAQPFFTSAAVDLIPDHSTVVAYPVASGYDDTAMVSQAVARFRFRLPAGYASTVLTVSPQPTGQVGSVIDALLYDCEATDRSAPLDPTTVDAARADLRALAASTIVVIPTAAARRGVPCAVSVANRIVGAAPQHLGGVYVWAGLPQRLGPPTGP